MLQRVSIVFATVIIFVFSAFAQFSHPPDPNYEMPGGFTRHRMGNYSETVRGTVRGADGAPINNARIILSSTSDGMIIASGSSNSDGSFTIQSVPSGSYEVAVQAGLTEVHDQVEVAAGDANIDLRVPVYSSSSAGQNAAVSVAQMKVPGKAKEELQKARKSLDKRNLGDAQKYVESALKLYPQYADALTVRGVLELDANQQDAARADFEQAIKDDNNCALAYIALGAAYNMAGRWDDSIRTLQHGLTLNPSSWQGYFELGKSYVAKGQYDAALDQLCRAQTLNPKYSAIYLLKAHALLGKKDYNDAISQLEVYLKVDPKGPQSDQVRQAMGRMQAYVASTK